MKCKESFLYVFSYLKNNNDKIKKVNRSKFKGAGWVQREPFWPILAIFCQIDHGEAIILRGNIQNLGMQSFLGV